MTFELTLPSDREIAMTRRFKASPDRVFRAFTQPALVRRWLLGPPDWSMPVCEIDLKVGGRIRYVWRHKSGQEMGLTGAFREIVPGERLVHTEIFDEDWTGGETIVTTTFAGDDDATDVRINVLYASPTARDAASRSGMEKGVAASYDRLDLILAETRVHIVEVQPRLAAIVRKIVPLANIASAQRAARAALDAALAEAGVQAAGPTLSVWRPPSDGAIDYAPGVFVADSFKPTGEISLFTLPSGRAAHLCFTGGYEGLPGAWGRVFDACKAEGWTPSGVNWEIYTEHGTSPLTDLYALVS